MSARVVSGLAPAGRPHPATKWSLLTALLVVVVLGVPKLAQAGAPAVQAPTGPGQQYQSGTYYFTGTYTFRTTAYCTNGNVVTDAHPYGISANFVFYGGADGSLYVSIDGSSLALLDSCGSPDYVGSAAASYTVQMGSPPTPTPTPTPRPTPNPTPTPRPTPTPSSGGSNNSGGGGGGSTYTPPSQDTSQSDQSGSPPSATPVSTGAATPAPSATPSPSASPKAHSEPMISAGSGPKSPSKSSPRSFGSINVKAVIGMGFLLLLGLVMLIRYSKLGPFLLTFVRRRWLRLEPYYFKLRAYCLTYTMVRGRDQPKRKGLSHHKHSGRLLAHHHTSYASLVFLLLITTGMAIGVAATSQADQADQALLSLTVLGPPPTQAATITSPLDGTVTTSSTVSVQGTCPSNVFVEIWRNGTFAGTTACSSNAYSVLVSLVPGGNSLVARVVDALGQYGPDSAAILVTYNAPPPPTPTPTPSQSPTPSSSPAASPSQVPKTGGTTPHPSPSSSPAPVTVPVITATVHNQDTDPGQPVTWQVTVAGGQPPYNVSWEWGDGSSSTDKLARPGTTSAAHTYQNGGAFNVIVRITDALGHQAALQLVTIVNGPGATAIGNSSGNEPGALFAIWPTLVAAGLITFSFWLGEKHLRAQQPPVHALEAT